MANVKRRFRPYEIIGLIILLLWMVFFNVIRLILSIQYRNIMLGYLDQSTYVYIFLSGGVWVLLGVVFLVLVLLKKRQVIRATLGICFTFLIWSFIDRFLVQKSHGNEALIGIINILLIIILVLLFLKFKKDEK